MNQVRVFQNIYVDTNNPVSLYPDSLFEAPGNSEEPPLVVHCSAGIGRTGTFITIEMCLRELSATGTVDVQNTVQRIRQQRAFCVQTEEQYAFCYVAVLEYCLRLKKDEEEIYRRIEKCLKNYKRDSFYSD